jgi:transposase-like protein
MVRRGKFSDEYKREAVRLATQPGVTQSQVAQELGINANLLGRWCRDYAANFLRVRRRISRTAASVDCFFVLVIPRLSPGSRTP